MSDLLKMEGRLAELKAPDGAVKYAQERIGKIDELLPRCSPSMRRAAIRQQAEIANKPQEFLAVEVDRLETVIVKERVKLDDQIGKINR